MEDWYELGEKDVGKPTIRAFGRTWPVEDFIGEVRTGDVGKRVVRRGGVLQVENEEQRFERLTS